MSWRMNDFEAAVFIALVPLWQQLALRLGGRPLRPSAIPH